MNLYLKNNYYSRIEWYKQDLKVKAVFPANIIHLDKRPETTKTYRLQPNKIIVDDVREFDCPNYTLRTAVAIDVFIQNIHLNIPCSEIYFFDFKTEKTSKFIIKYLTLDLKNEELEKEHYLANVLSNNKNRQALSEEFDILTGFEFVSSIIANGGL